MTETPWTTAATEGPEWGARAAEWARTWARMAQPARIAIAEATGIGPGTRVLDIGCGSGELVRLAADRGAEAAGIDAAEGMIEVARAAAPGADLRVGPMERLPWPDAAFDVVTAVNSLQFAADFTTAAREAARVTRPRGRVAICNWGGPDDRELLTVFRAVAALEPPEPEPEDEGPPRPDVGDPAELERLARAAGLRPITRTSVAVPYECPDVDTLEHAVLHGGGLAPAVGHSGAAAVRDAVTKAAAPYRTPLGGYRFHNAFNLLVAEPGTP